jgi:hypothetical protein
MHGAMNLKKKKRVSCARFVAGLFMYFPEECGRCRVLVNNARVAPKAQTSLRWLIIHIFPGREGNVIPWRTLYGCVV